MIKDIEKLFNKNVLVAGGTGLMGSTALEILSGYESINIFAVKHKSKPKFDSNNITWIEADLSDFAQCLKVVENMDVVFMFAGVLGVEQKLKQNPSKYVYFNNMIYSSMITASYYHKIETIFLLSSITGYPLLNRELSEDDYFTDNPFKEQFGLGWTYRYIEKQAQYYGALVENPIDIIVIRPTTIYGKYEGFAEENIHFLPSLVKNIIDNDSYEVWGDGNEIRDFVHAKDVLGAFLHLYGVVKGYNVYNFSGKTDKSVKEIIDLIVKISKKSNFKVKYDISKRKNVKFKKINCDKIDSFKYCPKIDIEVGIKELIEEYKRVKK